VLGQQLPGAATWCANPAGARVLQPRVTAGMNILLGGFVPQMAQQQ